MTVAPLIAEAPETDITSPSRLSAPEECQLDVIDPMVDSVWDRLVASHAGSTVFYSSAWMRVLCETYVHKPIGLQRSTGDQAKAPLPILEVTSSTGGPAHVQLYPTGT
jgi:hypothetical protein